ncbi:hypothetical protein Tco_0435105 [Tanacetum coccineum]
MLLAMKDEAESHLNNEENDFMLDNAYAAETTNTVPSYDDKAVSQLAKKAFKERENQYLDDILDLEEKLSSHDRIVYKMVGLGYQNPKHLKKAIAAQPKMYDGDMLHSEKLIINSTDSEETLEDAEESQNKMKNKMIQVNYDKINALYETFVPQQEIFAEQTYFSIPSTSNHSSKSKDVPSESPVLKMPNKSQLLKMMDKLGDALTGFYTKINKTLLKDAERRWFQNKLREFYKTGVIPASRSLYNNLKDIKEELIVEVQEIEIQDCVLLSATRQKHDLLKDELEKSSNDFKEIQANLLNRIKILKNDFQRPQAQSIDFELKLQHQKEKMACDVPWKSKLSTLNFENVLLKGQVNSKTVKSCVNVVNNGSNIVCISCGNDVFLNSHEKCVARHPLSKKSSVKRALFTSPLAVQSKNLGATFVVTKSRLSVAKTPTVTSKIVDSGCSKHMIGSLQLLRNFIEKFMGTVRFGNDHFAAITCYSDYVQGNLIICHVYYVEGLGHNLFSVGQFSDGDLK